MKKLNGEVAAVLATPETQKWFINEGAEAVNRTPEDFRKWILVEMVKWTRVAKQAGIKVE